MKRPDSELNSGAGIRVWQSLVLCVLLVAVGVGSGILIERLLLAPTTAGQFQRLDTVYQVIQDDFYYMPITTADRDDVSRDMQIGAIQGALSSLNDPYTRYLDISESNTAQEELHGKYGGIGVEITLHNDVALVTGVIPGSPAEKVGMLPGDVVQRVNGEPVPTTSTNDILRLLRGDVGETIAVTVQHAKSGEITQYEMELEEIVVPSVVLTFIDGTDYALIRISIFGDSTATELDAAIAEIHAHGSAGIILDLRGNGGGWVGASQQVLGRFLDPTVGPALFERRIHTAEPVPLAIEIDDAIHRTNLPLVVLVNGGTASASEIVAGALQDYSRATIIGSVTYGKGSVQRIYEFEDGSTLRVTIAEWYTPQMQRLQQNGITPNVAVPDEPSNSDPDPALAEAIRQLDSSRLPSDATPVATPAKN